MKQSFFLRDAFLGSRDIPPTFESNPNGHAPGVRFRHSNLALFCPACGEIWGRVLHDVALPEWKVETRHCASHPAPVETLVGWTDWKRGSFIALFPEIPDSLTFAPDWPPAVCLHEIRVLLSKLRPDHTFPFQPETHA